MDREWTNRLCSRTSNSGLVLKPNFATLQRGSTFSNRNKVGQNLIDTLKHAFLCSHCSANNFYYYYRRSYPTVTFREFLWPHFLLFLASPLISGFGLPVFFTHNPKGRKMSFTITISFHIRVEKRETI